MYCILKCITEKQKEKFNFLPIPKACNKLAFKKNRMWRLNKLGSRFKVIDKQQTNNHN